MSVLEVQVQGAIGALRIDVVFKVGHLPLVIVGPNGSGKTSVLRMILGDLRPSGGRIALDGRPLFDRQRAIDLDLDRRRVGYVPQRYALFPHLDVLSNVAYGVRGTDRAERARVAREALADLDVLRLAARRPGELSGGEMQRVALARALASRPHALLLDEPLAALDSTVRRDVRRFLVDRLRVVGIPTIVVTHDAADAEAMNGQVVVIEQGAVTQIGDLSDLAAAPRTAFVKSFTENRGRPNGKADSPQACEPSGKQDISRS